jgi:hypothetical protein
MRVLFIIVIASLPSLVLAQTRFTREAAVGLERFFHVIGDSGDLDGDGDKDIVISAFEGQSMPSIHVYEVEGNTFTERHIGATTVIYGHVKFGDLNNDGLLDILITGTTVSWQPHFPSNWNVENTLRTEIFINQGNWNFEKLQQSFQGFFLNGANIVDINNDGNHDLFFSGITYQADELQFKSLIYLNDGHLNFTKHEVDLPDIVYVESDWYDYNEDGLPDLAIMGHMEDGSRLTKLYTNSGDFQSVNTHNELTLLAEDDLEITTADYEQATLEWVDLNNDGKSDLFQSAKGQLFAYENLGDGEFATHNFGTKGKDWSYAEFGDLNGDNHIDIMLKTPASRADSEMLYLDGNFGFLNTTTSLIVSNDAYSSSFGFIEDFDGDGKNDVCRISRPVEGGNNVSHIYLMKGGIETLEIEGVVAPFDQSIAIDFDLDGDLDVIAATNLIQDNFESSVYWFKNTGDGKFEPIALTGFPKLQYTDIEVADYNGDQLPDLIMTGLTKNNIATTTLYRHTDDHNLTPVNSEFVPNNVFLSDILWFDYDHDSDLDLFISGATKADISSSCGCNPRDADFSIYQNVSDSLGVSTKSFFQLNPNNVGVEPFQEGRMRMADLDRDGQEELITLGKVKATEEDPVGINRLSIYKLRADLSGYTLWQQLSGLYDADMDVGDLNMDGFPDIVLGGRKSDTELDLYWLENMSGESFERRELPEDGIMERVWTPSIHVVDFDKNGRPDIIVNGWVRFDAVTTYIITNHESGDPQVPQFDRFLPSGRIRLTNRSGEISIGDLDNDGDADFAIAGHTGSLLFFKNNMINKADTDYDNGLSSPVNVNVTTNGYDADFTWENQNDLPVTYKILLDDGSEEDLTFESFDDEKFRHLNRGAHGPINVNTYSMINLNDRIYEYKIIAIGPGLETPEVIINGSFEITRPYAPVGLSASIVSDTEVQVTWLDASANEEGYEVQRSTDPDFSTFETISLQANSTQLDDNNLTPGTTYAYRIKAVRGNEESMPSKTILATTSGTVTSTENNEIAKLIRLIPNPSKTGRFELRTEHLGIREIRVVEATGNTIFTETITPSGTNVFSKQISLEAVSPGIYFVIIRDDQGAIGIKRLVVN